MWVCSIYIHRQLFSTCRRGDVQKPWVLWEVRNAFLLVWMFVYVRFCCLHAPDAHFVRMHNAVE